MFDIPQLAQFMKRTTRFQALNQAHVAPVLQELVEERVTDVLPALENLFLEELNPSGPVQEAVGQFVAARQLLDHPVVVSRWNVTKEVLLRRI